MHHIRCGFLIRVMAITISTAMAACSGESVFEAQQWGRQSEQSQRVNSSSAICEDLPPLKTSRSLFISDTTVLSQTLTFQSALEAISNTEGTYFPSSETRAKSFFLTWHDSLNPKEMARFSTTDFPHCDDELDADKLPAMNGYALECPRNEQIFSDRQLLNPFAGTGLQSVFIPLAVVNRFDLTPTDFSTCGEVRVVFGLRNPPVPLGRHLIIFEAEIPNPQPGCVNRCRAYAQEWAQMSAINTNLAEGKAEAAAKLKQILFQGVAGFPAVLKWEHFTKDAGHVRTNSLVTVPGTIGSSWVLRQFQLERRAYKGLVDAEGIPTVPDINSTRTFSAEGYHIIAVPQPVTDSPPVELVSNNLSSPQAQAFVAHLTSQVMPQLAPTVPLDPNIPQDLVNHIRGSILPQYWAAESRTENTHLTNLPNASLLVAHNYGALASNELKNDIASAIPPGSNLTAAHYINRMTFNSCAGCHHAPLVGELAPNQIYQKDFRFFHVNSITRIPCERLDGQQGTVNNCFQPSSVLLESFLPHRMKVLQQYLATNTQCGECDADSMVTPGTAKMTLGGQPVGSH